MSRLKRTVGMNAVTPSKQHWKNASRFVKAAAIAVALPLGACSNQSGIGGPGTLQAVDTAAPVQLNATGARLTTPNQSIVMPIDRAVAAKAVTNYQINKGGKSGPYEYRGADLNADGRPELIVYLKGDAWCAKSGCTLAVLRADKHSYKAVSTIRRVKPPIRVRADSANGWRTLVVNTGGDPFPLQTVVLKFSGRGYPGNAETLPPLSASADRGIETLFDVAPAPSLAISPVIQ